MPRAEFARSAAVIEGLNADYVRELAALAVSFGTVTVRSFRRLSESGPLVSSHCILTLFWGVWHWTYHLDMCYRMISRLCKACVQPR